MTLGVGKAAQSALPKRLRPLDLAAIGRRARFVIAFHPEWIAWSGLAVALLCIYRSLGLADTRSLGIWINSDTLYPVNVSTDLFHDGYSLAGWRFSIAPVWFPDMFATGIFWALTRNVIVATLLAGFIQVGLIIGALHVIGKAVGVRSLPLQDSILLLVGVLVSLYVAEHPGAYYPALYRFFLPQTHVGSLLSVLWAWALLLVLIRSRQAGQKMSGVIVIAYAAVCVLGGMSNLLFFPHMLAAISAGLLFGIFLGAVKIGDCWLLTATGWLAAAVGAVLNRVLVTATSVGAESGISYDRVLTALDTFMRGFVAKTLTGDLQHLVALAWLGICIGYAAWIVRFLIIRGRAHVTSEQIMRAIFLVACLFSSLFSAGSIILGGSIGLVEFKDYLWSMHYLHMMFLFPLFAVPMVISWVIEKMVPASALRAVAWMAVLAAFILPIQRFAGTPYPKAPISTYQPPLIRLMDRAAVAKSLHYGLAGYWQARLITLLSKSGLRVYAVNSDLSPFLWVNNEQWYRESVGDRKRPPRYDFVILDDPIYKISRERVIQVFGEPVSELRQDGTRILIYSNAK